MKKLLVVLGLLLLVSAVPVLAQAFIAAGPSYYVDYYSNNINPLTADQVIRAINVGTLGTPPISPVGDICQNVYVFDNNQEMIACCACRLTPNELSSAAVGAQLTNHSLTGIAPLAGVVKIAFTIPQATGCKAETAVLAGADATYAAVFGTHLQAEPPSSPTALFVTETGKLPQILGPDEATFLPQACGFVRYLGSGAPGTCSCTAGVSVAPLAMAIIPNPITVAPGSNTVATLQLSVTAPAGGLTVNLMMDNAAIASVPATGFVPMGNISAPIVVTGIAVGNTTLHATALGFTEATAGVHVSCGKPVANAGPNQTVTVNSLVQLNGSGSTDACGLPLTFQWNLIGVPPGSTAALSNPIVVNPTFIADRPGSYTAQLIVNNGALSSDSATVMITANP